MTIDAWITLAVVGATVSLLILDRFNSTLVMGGAVLALYALGVIDQDQLLAGVANESLVIVAALYVLAGAADITGAFDGLTSRLLGGASRTRPRGELMRVCGPSAAASAFIANTPLVAMLAPRVLRWCRRTGRSPSLYLMPLSYAVILGGCMTMIGTSVNLFVNDLIDKAGLGRLNVFAIVGIGLPLALGGIVLMVLLGPRLLRDRTAPGEVLAGTEREFTVEMTVVANSSLAGATVAEAGLRNLDGVFLIEVERAEKVIAAVGPEEPLAAGDRLVFVGNLTRVLDLQRISGLVSAEARHFADLARNPQRQFVEAVIGAGSPLIGSSLKASGFRRRYGSAVVAIHRASEQLKGKLGDVRLRAGDVLLVLAGPDFYQRYREHRDFAVVSPLNQDMPIRREHSRTVELAIAALILLAGTGALDLMKVSLLIAFGLIIARIVTLRDARRFIDVNVLLLIATSFGLGTAVEQSGLASSLADLVVAASDRLGNYGLLVAVLAATMLVTEVISNIAAAAMMFPIAIAVAEQAQVNPLPFAVLVIFGASLSFLTPIGYQTNTMVWAMGGYRYTDFARLGAPLTLFVLLATPALVPMFFPL
ncbi:SLC13 family permease [Mycobacterium sp. IDR2000157661]|uniref:SLC13 family permease n=1 Tax=Mycobacterium sp. IDR2000157661 TaxID=2867005 RepID=UPI001EEAC6FB|nr:SLC13 family permease [Mycobacterium sp. IDR2000157661]ULE33963.1 SLC13 family permease [Mycobacterium sp. IDR2000157661]